MKFRIEKSFDKDVDNINDKKLRAFLAVIESAESMQEIPHLRKIEGYNSFYESRLVTTGWAWKSHVKKLSADKTLMKQIVAAEKARRGRKSSEYISWEKIKRNV